MLDYVFFKHTQNSYLEYLQKFPIEVTTILNDPDERWAILCNKAYNGPVIDTPDLRKITICKETNKITLCRSNADLSHFICPVECCFGGFKALWKFTRTVFRLVHSSFDEHFEILGLLTNEHLRA